MNNVILSEATDIIENEHVFCCLLNDNIFYSYIKPNIVCSVEDIEVVFNHYRKLAIDGPLPLIAEMGQHSVMDKPSREYLQNHKEDAVCEAAVIHNLAQRLLINFYHSFKSHSHPSKVFKTYKSARIWVNSIMAKNKQTA